MEAQHQIKRTLSRPENVALIRQMLVDGGKGLMRTALAEKVCERFGFLDARGRGTCLKALRDLERIGQLTLPPRAAGEGRRPAPRLSGQRVPKPRFGSADRW